MKSVGPLPRLVALAGLFTAALFTGPVLAAKADVELLQSYIGNWRGKGQLVGAVLVVVGDDLSNLEAVKAAKVPGKAKERFAPLFAELEAQ